ncbi:MAG: hypothetical protein V4671_19860 [Armatimonadota bacterium]
MAHTSHQGPANLDPDQLARLGYETRDIALNTLSRWLVGLFIFIAVAIFGTLGLYKALVPTWSEVEKMSPIAHVRTYPPNPQLQARPRRDMIEYRGAEEKLLNSYTKGENGTVNLPVDRAIDLLAERGISGVKGGQPAAPGTVSPVSNEAAGDMNNPGAGSSGLTDGNAGPNIPGSSQPELKVNTPGPAAGTTSPHVDH